MIKRMIERHRYMREHRWTHAHYSAFLDHDLTETESARFEEHARICPQCHRMLASLKKTIRGLRGLSGEANPPGGLADSVIERLRSGG